MTKNIKEITVAVRVLMKDMTWLLPFLVATLVVRPDKLACVARPWPHRSKKWWWEEWWTRSFGEKIFFMNFHSSHFRSFSLFSYCCRIWGVFPFLACLHHHINQLYFRIFHGCWSNKVQWGRSWKVRAASLISSSWGWSNLEIEMRHKKGLQGLPFDVDDVVTIDFLWTNSECCPFHTAFTSQRLFMTSHCYLSHKLQAESGLATKTMRLFVQWIQTE